MKPNFDYQPPSTYELQELYVQPYRFSEQLIERTNYIFTHPHFKYYKLFYNQVKPTDANDMLKRPYLLIRYFLDHPQQFGHSLNNLIPHIMVLMWKTFLALRKFRGEQFSTYKAMDMKVFHLFEHKFLDIFLDDIKNHNFKHNDEMIKERVGLELRERKPMGYSNKMLDYFDSLE